MTNKIPWAVYRAEHLLIVHTPVWTMAIRGPKNVAAFSERYAATVIPLGFGWRITIRRR